MLIIFLVGFLIITQSCHSNKNEDYTEEIFIKPLANGNVYSYFQFTNRWKLGPEDDLHNTYLMPLSISSLLNDFNIKELHVSLTQGLWRYENWGYPVIDSPPGAEVWAWFAGNLTKKEIDSQWKYLASTLSGMLCASLNFIDKANTIEPKYTFRPKFANSSPLKNNKFIRYSTLPREIVCTENLTPWKKLLPCNSKVGFASLLNAGSIHNTNYHSLGLSIRTLCDDIFTEGCIIEFTQTASLVYDTKILDDGGKEMNGFIIKEYNEFSITRMFGKVLNDTCPLAKSSKIYVDITENKYNIQTEPDKIFNSIRGGHQIKIAEYDVKNNILHNIAWIPKKNTNIVPIIPMPPLVAHRYILGHGQERGIVVTKIINSHWQPLNIILMENIPWYVPSYMHTLKIRSENSQKEIIPEKIHYIPGEQRERAYQLELALKIPPRDTIEISFDFDYIFLKWLEYPPDANHGHYLGAAVITTLLPIGKNYTAIPVEGYLFEHSFNATRSSYFLQIHTEILIVSLPTPDFSMPYNVICLACTVVALAFGPIHTVTTKIILVVKSDDKKSLLERLKNKLFKKKLDDVSQIENENLLDINNKIAEAEISKKE